jgi:chromate transporter
MLWQLFVSFLKLGALSFGGGYAMIPLIEHEAAAHGWVTDTAQFTNIIAIAGMSPGPIAANSAAIIGYQQAGIPGAVVSVLATAVPSFLVIVLLLTVLRAVHHHPLYISAFYGVRPVVVALIAYAAVRFALSNQMLAFSWHTLGAILICAASLFALIRYKVSPVTVILLSGVAGAVMYG